MRFEEFVTDIQPHLNSNQRMSKFLILCTRSNALISKIQQDSPYSESYDNFNGMMKTTQKTRNHFAILVGTGVDDWLENRQTTINMRPGRLGKQHSASCFNSATQQSN